MTRQLRYASARDRGSQRSADRASAPELPDRAPSAPRHRDAGLQRRADERTYADIPHDMVSRIILVDDVSHDETVDVARKLGLDVIIHRQNLGYGGNQKTCYRAALAPGPTSSSCSILTTSTTRRASPT